MIPNDRRREETIHVTIIRGIHQLWGYRQGRFWHVPNRVRRTDIQMWDMMVGGFTRGLGRESLVSQWGLNKPRFYEYFRSSQKLRRTLGIILAPLNLQNTWTLLVALISCYHVQSSFSRGPMPQENVIDDISGERTRTSRILIPLISLSPFRWSRRSHCMFHHPTQPDLFMIVGWHAVDKKLAIR